MGIRPTVVGVYPSYSCELLRECYFLDNQCYFLDKQRIFSSVRSLARFALGIRRSVISSLR